MRNRHKRTIKNILIRKGTSMLTAFIVVALFGVPFMSNVKITITVAFVTLIKDFFLDKFFYNQLVKDLKS